MLTVIKPTMNIGAFMDAAMPHIINISAVSMAAAIILSLGASMWITQQVGRLTRYANDVRAGHRVPFPKLAPTELKTMGTAFEKMREALAGHAYAEQYVEALTHEIKSPLSAIRGAAELLEDPSMAPAERVRFLSNIQDETLRIQDLVDRMLQLTELEAKRALGSRSPVHLPALVRTILEAAEPALLKRNLHTEVRIGPEVVVSGDLLLIHLAISNLVQNAIDFSPEDGRISVTCTGAGDHIELSVEDEGPGVPEFARQRLFDKFFSLERPDTGQKSTGLGLNFVKEVAALHGGRVEASNRPEGGLRARLILPVSG